MASYEAKRKKHPWRARLRLQGRSVFLGYFPTKAEALRRECEFMEEVLYGVP